MTATPTDRPTGADRDATPGAPGPAADPGSGPAADPDPGSGSDPDDAAGDGDPVPEGGGADGEDAGGDRGRRVRLGLVLLAAVAFVVCTVGPPLFGRGVFLGSDTIYNGYPWRAFESPANLETPQHGPISDTVDAVFPARAAFADAVHDGELLAWNPWVAGGIPAGVSSSGLFDPFALLYLVLPTWLAPAIVKALQLVASIGFTYLFCRRLGTDRLPAVFAGIAFAGSGFMVMWTNWQQTDVAALIPALFWSTERFLQRRTVAAAVPIALTVAAMLAGSFPAVVFYAAYVLVPYVAVRVLADRGHRLPQRLATGAGAGLGLLAGALLAAAIVLPFLGRADELNLAGRAQRPRDHLPQSTLVTTVAPKALGLSTEWPTLDYFGPINQVETVAFVGATTALLALAGVCLPGTRRAPPGARLVLVAATVVLGWATYVGGTLLGLLQHLPAFDTSFVGRTRSVLGFTVAVLAGLGAQALLERAWPRRAAQWAGAAVAVAAAAFVALRVVRAANRVGWAQQVVHEQRLRVLLPLAVGAGAVACALLMRSRRAAVATGAMVAVTGLLVVESLNLSLPLLPNEDRATLYPETPAHRFLEDTLGDDRMAVEGFTFFSNSTMLSQLRSSGGHAFHAATWKQALRAVDPEAFGLSPTVSTLHATPAVMSSPFLDRLGARWFAATPDTPPPGRRRPVPGTGAGSCRTPVALDEAPPIAVPDAAGLRAVVVEVCDTAGLPHDARLVGRVTTAGRGGDGDGGDGDPQAEGLHELPDAVGPGAVLLALPADRLTGPAEVALSLEGAGGAEVAVAATPSGAVAAETVRATGDDGLRLVYAHDLVVYQRLAALPRIRWAGDATVVGDEDERLATLAEGGVDDGTVVLSGGRAGGDGRPGEVDVTRDVPGSIRAEVDAEGDGYLVVSDALQSGWSATVDGERADLVDAEHAGVAVPVPAGRHEVALRYEPEGLRPGLVISAVTAVVLAGLVVAERRRAYR